jgi:hypothetical protein
MLVLKNSFILKIIILSLFIVPSIVNAERGRSHSSFDKINRGNYARPIHSRNYYQPVVVYPQPVVVYHQPVVVYSQPVVVYPQPVVVYREPYYYNNVNVVYGSPGFSFGLGIRNSSYHQNNYISVRIR